MAGYNKLENKSNNAVQAERDCIFMRKDAERFLVEKFSITKKEAAFILDWTMTSEWHHVGSRYKRVRFYDLSDSSYPNFLEDRMFIAKESYEHSIIEAKAWYASLSLTMAEKKISVEEFVKLFLKAKIKSARNPESKRLSILDFL